MDPKGVSSFDQLDALLVEGKITEDEYQELWNAMKGRGTGAGPVKGASAEARQARLTARETIVVLVLCCFAQIAGLVGVDLGNPILPAVGGFAAIVVYIATLREWRYVKRIAMVAAVAGGCELVLTVLTAA